MKILISLLILSFSILAKDKSFTISYDPNYAPFSYTQDGNPTGLFIDIWKLWAKYNNYDIEFVNGELWDNSLNLVKDKKVDFFLGTSDYENWMLGSNNFYEIRSSFFILKTSNVQIENKDNLKIGLIGKAHKNTISNSFPNSEIKIYDDYIYSINALKSEEVDLIYDDKIAIEFFSVQNNLFGMTPR